MPSSHNGTGFRRRNKKLMGKRDIKENFQEYCSASSIHGVQYVGDPARPPLEKIYWVLIFIVSFSINVYLIYQTWYKWQESPVIVSFSETTTPVWEVPFPAITICLQANSRRHQFYYKEADGLNRTEDLEERSAMSLICDAHINVEGGSEFINETMIDYMIDVAPDILDTIFACKVRDKMIDDCNELFSPVMTEDGLCFTSNVLNQSELFRPGWGIGAYPDDVPSSDNWRLETGYKANAPIDTYPLRALDSGDKAGIYIILNGNKSNQDPLCKGPIPGYKVMLHNPAEIPSSSQRYIRIPIDQEILVWVQPNIMTTSEGLRGYDAKRRQCFYSDERYLKYFNIYTERNCELECLTNFTLKHCGCVAYYMPRDKSTPICGGPKKQCTVDAMYALRKEEVYKSYEGIDEDSCNCLPACTAINYQAETSQTVYEWKSVIEAAEGVDLSGEDDWTMSRVTIFFSDTQFTTSHRSELFGVVDFLANIGGILGLFSGISFLSFLEIFYFLTLRFYYKVDQNKKERAKEGQEMQSMTDNYS